GDEALDLLDALRDVDDQQGVGAAVVAQAAAARQEAAALLPLAAALALAHAALALLGEQLGDVLGAAVGDRDVLRDHLGALFELEAGLGDVLLELRDLGLRGHPDDVAVAALVERLGLQDDVQRLVPGHVDEPQGDVAGDVVAGDDVQVRQLGVELQHGAHRDVLEVERDRAAAVGAGIGL